MKKILLCLVMIGALFGLTGCGNDSVEELPQEEIQDFGYVKEETVQVLVSKFNTEVVDNSSLNPAW